MIDDRTLTFLRQRGLGEEQIAATADAIERRKLAEKSDPELQTWRSRFGGMIIPAGWVERHVLSDGRLCDHPKRGLRVIVSLAREDDGQVWVHASMSRRDRQLPTYEQMGRLYREFMSPDLPAYQVFAPEAEHVNLAEVLHLWQCLTARVTPDFRAGGVSI